MANTNSKATETKTYRFEARTPNGRWFVTSRGVSAVEADAYRARCVNDRNFRIVPE